jgi:hypothetical protein
MYIDTAFPCTYLLYLLLIFFQFRHIILYITCCDRPYIYRMGTTPVFFLYTFVLRRRIIYTIVSAKSISLSLGSLLLLLQRPTKVQRFQKIIQYALGNIHRNIYLSRIYRSVILFLFFPIGPGRISTTPSFNNK